MLRNEYPRPQLQRKNWQPLNGEWEFIFDDENIGLRDKYYLGDKSFDRKIIVPFAYQTELSGINLEEVHEILWYKRTFDISDLKNGRLLCFNGVDYFADVWINGIHVCFHEGGYTSFEVDISKYVKIGENIIVVRAYDPEEKAHPRGKQSATGKRYGCWYIASSGIYKSVWIEEIDKDCIKNVSLLTDFDNNKVYGDVISVNRLADKLHVDIIKNDKNIVSGDFDLVNGIGKFELVIPSEFVYSWTPETPNLYKIIYKMSIGCEIVDITESRFGLRKMSINENGIICLNNVPYYQKLVLDQGYWADGGLTPGSVEDLKNDIIMSKQMGFNGARKHQKIEDPYWYYYADELGFLTWCEMPSAYNFSFTEISAYHKQFSDIIRFASVFTSVVCYVPLNESWGTDDMCKNKLQRDFARSLYYTVKAIDPTRLVCTNDGWEAICETDLVNIHDYAFDSSKFIENYTDTSKLDKGAPVWRRLVCDDEHYHGQPLLFSEFGGIAFAKDATGENWGYGESAKDGEEIYKRIDNLVKGLKDTYFQGYCYTQLTDVQQEVNGLLDKNHKPKFEFGKLFNVFVKY